jgi:hypothetical protein
MSYGTRKRGEEVAALLFTASSHWTINVNKSQTLESVAHTSREALDCGLASQSDHFFMRQP